MTMNSESCQIILLPTGGLSSARCSSIQEWRLMGGARGIVALLYSGCTTASTVNGQRSTVNGQRYLPHRIGSSRSGFFPLTVDCSLLTQSLRFSHDAPISDGVRRPFGVDQQNPRGGAQAKEFPGRMELRRLEQGEQPREPRGPAAPGAGGAPPAPPRPPIPPRRWVDPPPPAGRAAASPPRRIGLPR